MHFVNCERIPQQGRSFSSSFVLSFSMIVLTNFKHVFRPVSGNPGTYSNKVMRLSTAHFGPVMEILLNKMLNTNKFKIVGKQKSKLFEILWKTEVKLSRFYSFRFRQFVLVMIETSAFDKKVFFHTLLLLEGKNLHNCQKSFNITSFYMILKKCIILEIKKCFVSPFVGLAFIEWKM